MAYTNIEKLEILRSKNGDDIQNIHCIEELSEVQKELCKFIRGEGNYINLVEEVSDAITTLEMIMLVYSIYEQEIRDYAEVKINRALNINE